MLCRLYNQPSYPHPYSPHPIQHQPAHQTSIPSCTILPTLASPSTCQPTRPTPPSPSTTSPATPYPPPLSGLRQTLADHLLDLLHSLDLSHTCPAYSHTAIVHELTEHGLAPAPLHTAPSVTVLSRGGDRSHQAPLLRSRWERPHHLT